MSNQSGIKFGLLTLAAILCLVGITFTELQQASYTKQSEQINARQKELEKNAPQILKDSLNKLLTTPTQELVDTETVSIVGCEYTNTYTGKRNQNEEFAQNTTDSKNNAPIPSLCSTDYQRLRSIYNKQAYWAQDKIYTKGNADEAFTEETSNAYYLPTRPSEYLSKYFKAYEEPQIDTVTQQGNNIVVVVTNVQDKKKTQLKLNITPPNTITSIGYQITQEESLTVTEGTINIKYEATDIKPEGFMSSELKADWIISQLNSIDTTIRVNYGNEYVYFDGTSKEIRVYRTSTENKYFNCKLQVQSCYEKYTQAIQILKDYLNNNITTIEKGECRTSFQSPTANAPKTKILSLDIQPSASKNTSFRGSIEMETDTATGKTTISNYTINNRCYETSIPPDTAENLLRDVITALKI